MRIETSYVDFSGINRSTPEYLRAMTRVHKITDPRWLMRMAYGASLKPAEISVLPVGNSILQLSRVVS